MFYRLEHTTPKCTTDRCRATRNVTHLTFATREQASAFIQRYAIVNVRIVEVGVSSIPILDLQPHS